MKSTRAENPMSALAAELRALRHESSLTLRELSQLTHVSDSSLSRYFGGQAIPPPAVVVALCQAANKDPAPLLGLCEQARNAQRQARWTIPAPQPESTPVPVAADAAANADRSAGPDAYSQDRPVMRRVTIGAAWVAMMAAAALGGYALHDARSAAPATNYADVVIPPDLAPLASAPAYAVPSSPVGANGTTEAGTTPPTTLPSATPSRHAKPAPPGRTGTPEATPDPDVSGCTAAPKDTYVEVQYLAADHSDWNGVDMAYPAELHGTVVRLYRGRTHGYAYAVAENAVADDVVSVERVTRPTDTSSKTWWRTSELSAWEYCNRRVERGNGRAATASLLNRTRAVRVCLQRAGGLRCTNIWYAGPH